MIHADTDVLVVNLSSLDYLFIAVACLLLSQTRLDKCGHLLPERHSVHHHLRHPQPPHQRDPEDRRVHEDHSEREDGPLASDERLLLLGRGHWVRAPRDNSLYIVPVRYDLHCRLQSGCECKFAEWVWEGQEIIKRRGDRIQIKSEHHNSTCLSLCALNTWSWHMIKIKNNRLKLNNI